MSQKTQYAGQIRATATKLAQVANEAEDIVSIYFDRGYNSGGASPIIDDDVASENLTAANIASFITLAQQLANFLGNAAVSAADYDATLNKTRGDI